MARDINFVAVSDFLNGSFYDSWIDDSYDPILFSESTPYSVTNLILSEWLDSWWVDSF